MSINWSTGIIKQVRQIAVKSSISMDKFSDTDIKEFLTVFDKAMKVVEEEARIKNVVDKLRRTYSI